MLPFCGSFSCYFYYDFGIIFGPIFFYVFSVIVFCVFLGKGHAVFSSSVYSLSI